MVEFRERIGRVRINSNELRRDASPKNCASEGITNGFVDILVVYSKWFGGWGKFLTRGINCSVHGLYRHLWVSGCVAVTVFFHKIANDVPGLVGRVNELYELPVCGADHAFFHQ
jgi:hypothetical protein